MAGATTASCTVFFAKVEKVALRHVSIDPPTMTSKTSNQAIFLASVADNPVSAILFVQDYVGVDFNGPLMYMFSDPIVTLPPGDTRELGFRDKICELIGQVVDSAEEQPDEFFKISFKNGMTLTLPLDQDSRVQVEAGTFHHQRGKMDIVW
ncbi:hypothetical protein [Pinirhizobacter soli]|uniref:hypothetical protein n=1 Tax=Pinirhizobacter soli TaxID=2786953 RepID=UPI00202A7255|nr:hypothetical protein [Pinirhizobacter soli]